MDLKQYLVKVLLKELLLLLLSLLLSLLSLLQPEAKTLRKVKEGSGAY